MTTVSPEAPDLPRSAELNPVASHLAERHALHLANVDRLTHLDNWMDQHREQAQAAQAVLDEFRTQAELRKVVSLTVQQGQQEMAQQTALTGWRPGAHPADITRPSLETQGVSPLRIPDLVASLVGQWVQVRMPDNAEDQKVGVSGLLVAVEQDWAIVTDGVAAPYTKEWKLRVAEIMLIEQWTAGNPNATQSAVPVCSCPRPLIFNDQGQAVHSDDGSPTCRADLATSNGGQK